jgi:hypothetical protein
MRGRLIAKALTGKDEHLSFPFCLPAISDAQSEMNLPAILRTVILFLSAASAGFGILVAVGVFGLPNLPEQFRVIIGIVICLYGTYRFVVAFFQDRN